ncbi:MAG: type II toxin-antitoxin system RelE/ParE family toxin [Acidobacteria bacterium]|nr:type II toxin-antitoxin system RelE/ParE family toxin [Acidobacteriota bacterium]
MTLSVSFRRGAVLDLERAEDWYESHRVGLGKEFREAVAVAVARISSEPELYPVLYRGARRILIRRFPYALWYRIEDDRLVVLACIHGRRNPSEITVRLN